MSSLQIGLAAIVAMIVLILLHVPVGAAMIVAALGSVAVLAGPAASLSLAATETVNALQNAEIGVIPLFLLMGGFASAAGLSADFYRLAYALFGHLRGGLAVATIGGCAGFGAVCGSSVATVATMTRIALPEMLARRYSAGLATGCIAAGGTLGFLIPPSIAFVVYAMMTEQFIISLFVAAVIPGILAVALHMAAIAAMTRLNPAAAPAGPRPDAAEIRRALRRAVPAFLLATIVLAGIYSGVFTVVEAAAVGAASSFVFFLWRRGLSFVALWEVLLESGANTAMIYLVLIGASIFNYTVTLAGIPEAVVAWILSFNLQPTAIVFALMVMYIALGCVFESIGAMVLTLPFVFPLITKLGYDPLWWGVMNVMVIEIGMITPPVGLNVLVLNGIAKDVPLKTIFAGTVPFLSADLVRLAILALFPVLATWLPRSFGYG